MRDKRLRYRTGTDLLSVTLLDMEGRKTPGRVLDVSAGGAGVFVLRRQDPGFELGKVVWACLRSQLISHRIVSSAQIRRIEDCGLGRLYGLEFLEAARLIGKMPPPLAAVFNRRRSERLRVRPERPVGIIIGGLASGELRGELRDISARGLAFRLDAGAVAEVESLSSPEVLLTAPGYPDAVAMAIQIGHSRRGVDGLYCGATFDPARIDDFAEQRRKLTELLAAAGLLPRDEDLQLPGPLQGDGKAFSAA